MTRRPPTKLKSLAQMDREQYWPLRGTAAAMMVSITDDDEYYAGHVIGFTAAHGGEHGGFILDDYPAKNGEGLTEWTYKGAEHLYSLHDRYNELLKYFKENNG